MTAPPAPDSDARPVSPLVESASPDARESGHRTHSPGATAEDPWWARLAFRLSEDWGACARLALVTVVIIIVGATLMGAIGFGVGYAVASTVTHSSTTTTWISGIGSGSGFLIAALVGGRRLYRSRRAPR
jgi:hypothetical protein